MKKRHAFLLGAVLGGVGALLLTPKSGKELRADLLNKVDELEGKIKEFDSEAFIASVTEEVEKVRENISNFDWEASKLELKEKVEEMTGRIEELKSVVDEHQLAKPVKLSQDDVLEDNDMLEMLQELEDLAELEASEK